MSKETWKDFEILTKKIQEDLSSDAEVILDYKITGKSKSINQCDVAVKSKIGAFNFLGIIECKDYNKKIGIKYLREFKSKLEDINASSGIFVTTIGYTKDAMNFATHNNIETYTLFDASNIDWNKHAFLPIVIEFIFIKNCKLEFKYKDTLATYYLFERENDFNYKRIFSNKEKIPFSIQDIICSIWDNQDLFDNEDIYLNFDSDDILEIESQRNIVFNLSLKTFKKNKIYRVPLEKGTGFNSNSDFLSNKYNTVSLDIEPNKLFLESEDLNIELNTDFYMRIIETIIKNPDYKLPQSITFSKNDKERKIEANFK